MKYYIYSNIFEGKMMNWSYRSWTLSSLWAMEMEE